MVNLILINLEKIKLLGIGLNPHLEINIYIYLFSKDTSFSLSWVLLDFEQTVLYSVEGLDKCKMLESIEEKSSKPKSNYAVIGLDLYPTVWLFSLITSSPSLRWELELTTINQTFLQQKNLLLDFDLLNIGTHYSLS